MGSRGGEPGGRQRFLELKIPDSEKAKNGEILSKFHRNFVEILSIFFEICRNFAKFIEKISQNFDDFRQISKKFENFRKISQNFDKISKNFDTNFEKFRKK